MTSNSPPRLRREMSGLGGLVITLTNLSPSIGVFLAASDVIHQSGSWVIGAGCLAVLLGVLVSGLYAELGSAFPHAGGEYTILSKTLGPTFGFGIAISSLLTTPVALALSAIGVTASLREVWPTLLPVPTAMGCIVVVSILAALSIRVNALITGLFMVVEIAALVATAVIGFAHPHRDLIATALHPQMTNGHGGLMAVPLGVMGLAGAGAVYAFNGYGSAIFFGEEVKGARRKMWWMVLGALGVGAVTILPPVAGVIVGARDLGALSASETPVLTFLHEATTPAVADAISLGVAVAIFNAMIAIALTGGRGLYAAARDRAFPEAISRPLSRVHVTFGSPWIATLLLGLGGLFLCLVPLNTLIIINGNSAGIVYALLALAVIRGRRTGSTAASRSRMILHPVGPVIVILTMLSIIASGLASSGSGRTGLLVAAGILCVGGLYYQLVVRHRTDWAHHEPDEDPHLT